MVILNKFNFSVYWIKINERLFQSRTNRRSTPIDTGVVTVVTTQQNGKFCMIHQFSFLLPLPQINTHK